MVILFFLHSYHRGSEILLEPVKKAREILGLYRDRDGLIDVDDLIDKNNIQLISWKFPERIRGCLIYEREMPFMGINQNLEIFPSLTLFTKAHELAHFFLHKNKQYFCLDEALGSNTNNKLEWEANAFAAELLMPFDLVKKYHKSMTTLEMCKMFKVSKEAIIYRLNNIGLI